MNRDAEKRREEIIRLQNEIIRQMTDKNLERVGDDLFGVREETEGDLPLTPPPGYPEVPVIDFTGKDSGKPAETAKEKKQQAAQKAEEAPPKEDIARLKEELNSLIGLDGVKREVDNLINLVTINKLRRGHGLKVEDISLHMVFSGNPGTGKTTIARIMSRIYHSLDILSKGHLVEADRSGLVAGYVGQTAIKTQEAVQKALGGVLFIDEAYALTTRGPQDYGQEAVETLLKAMEDYRDDLIVIVAGYIELMEEFVHSNPGLESRFNRFIHFPDYTVEEMMGIFRMRCDKAGYTLAEDAKDELEAILTEKSKDPVGFGNARGVRNLFEKSISRQANRLSKLTGELSREQLMEIRAEDLLETEEEQEKTEDGETEAAQGALTSAPAPEAAAIEIKEGETKHD